MDTKIVSVDLGSRGYDIYIGAGLLKHIDDFLPVETENKKVFIITDQTVQHYAEDIKSQIQNKCAWVDVYALPSGEKTKSFKYFQAVMDWMLENGILRGSLIIAVGGGVIGDLAGFASATVLRGVPFVQIPTTLLAQVDSSVGGKTGINTKQGKNLVGSFYQPDAVIADIDTLKTLPKRQILAGYAEIVKYGLIDDYDFFEWLEDNGKDVVRGDPYALSHAIEKSCEIKAKIVKADERETGIRAHLNLGHTFGHALESAMGYSKKLLHGEAVAIGTIMALDLSVRMGICEADDLERVKNHFRAIKIPINANHIDANVDSLFATMRRDKKATEKGMTFILCETIGEAVVRKDAPEHLIREVLEASLKSVQ